MSPLAFALGALGWTLAEYLIHRFDGHGMKGKTPFSREHLAHHADPLYFAATWKKVLIGTLVAVLVGTATSAVLGPPGWAFTAGFLAMYATYEVLHRRIHVAPPLGPYERWARKHHLLHHHGNPDFNHGVTTPLWDWVFGTLHTADVVKVPWRRAPSWLVDPETGDVAARFADTFAVMRR